MFRVLDLHVFWNIFWRLERRYYAFKKGGIWPFRKAVYRLLKRCYNAFILVNTPIRKGIITVFWKSLLRHLERKYNDFGNLYTYDKAFFFCNIMPFFRVITLFSSYINDTNCVCNTPSRCCLRKSFVYFQAFSGLPPSSFFSLIGEQKFSEFSLLSMQKVEELYMIG